MADLSDVLLTSVPGNERPFAETHLPGAHRTSERLSPELTSQANDAKVLACMIHDPVTPEALAKIEGLQAVITRSDGYDHLPLDWLTAEGVAAYHLHDYAVPAVAEHTLLFIQALLRRLPEGQARTLQELGWRREDLIGRSLTDVTVGLLGTGRIGGRVARLLTSLGVQVVGYDIEPDPEIEALDGFRYTDSLEALLEASQVLSVHVPLDDATNGMIDARALDRLPEDACLVNTARGDILDQGAVEAALRDGRLAGYAADVLPGEPEPPDLARFSELDRVLITPHLAAHDQRTMDLRYARTAEIARAVLDGKPEAVETYRVA